MKKTDGFLSKSEDALGNRMKALEGMEADRRVMPRLPVLARLDGRAFHSFTRKASAGESPVLLPAEDPVPKTDR